ncbi:hypothetical protein Q1695_012147 [Nippostrongylus brasiliensis]|nr:hypothetical protein Q1695_012147 [Nippostrongylus brasiliensis]
MKSEHADDVDDGTVSQHLLSNAFRLQCEDAERERHPDPNVVSKCEALAKKVVSVVKDAKLKHSCQYKDLSMWATHGVNYPLNELRAAIEKTTSSEMQYRWSAPKEVTIIGESATNLLCSNQFTVTIFLMLPDSLFGKRDYVNLTYAAKRAHYMCSTVVLLRKSFADLNVAIVPGFANDKLFPNVEVTDKESAWKIVIHFGASDAALKNNRFAPNVSNLRASTIYPHCIGRDEEPTPHYNQRVLRTIQECAVTRRVSAELRHKETVTAALALANRWFANRGMMQFDPLFLACFMAHLLEDNVIAKQQDSVTILKNFFVAIVNWDTSMAKGFHPSSFDEGVIKSHLEVFPIVLLDSTGYWNIASGISKESLMLAKSDISRSLLVLGDCLAFDTLFLEKHHFYSLFDHYFRLVLTPEDMSALLKNSNMVLDTVNEDDRLSRFMAKLLDKIETCMGERFDSIGIKRLNSEKQNAACYLIGFRTKRGWTDPITMGPVATDASAKAFRMQWKEKTQLRKFADARICECMVWGEAASSDVPLSILEFILTNHFELHDGCITMRSVLPEEFSSKKDVNTKITTAFASLSAILRTAKGLPLMVTNIHGISPYLRGTEPNASEVLCKCDQGQVENDHRLLAQRAVPPYTGSVEVHIKLEYSGKWGDSIAGVRQLSAAFFIEIAKYLKEKQNVVAVPTMDQLFVVKDGVVFKLVLVLDKILKILEQRVEKVKASGAARIEMSIEGQRLSAWKKQYVHEALLQASLQSFATKHAVWICNHFMTNSVPDLALEMIVAAAFEHPVLPPPRTTLSAFRRVLQLIVKHNWTARPLFVDFDNAWNEEEVAKLESNFVKMRPILPPMVIITNEDPVGSRWTRDGPTPLALKRIIALAASSLKVFDLNFENSKRIDVKSVFSTVDLSIFDAVIEVFPKMVVRKTLGDAIDVKGEEALPVVNLDPVEELVFALNSHFHQVALFFWNRYGGDRIGIKWKPHELEVPSKISRCSLHCAPSSAAGCLRLNKEEILEGIRILGRGIVKDIQCST